MNIASFTNVAFIGNLAGPDMILILLVVLLLFGAKKLPELAKGMGQAVREFSKAKDEVEHEIMRPATVHPPQSIEQPKVAANTDIPSADLHSTSDGVKEAQADETTHQV